MRARDYSSSANPLVRYCHFGVSPVNYSDSDSDSVFLSNESKQLLSTYKLHGIIQRIEEKGNVKFNNKK